MSKLPNTVGPLYNWLGHFNQSKFLEQGHNDIVSDTLERIEKELEGKTLDERKRILDRELKDSKERKRKNLDPDLDKIKKDDDPNFNIA